eukprot:TRINITY_DN17796_c0_g1_i1.p1 TRINITY_DN17796_c0_g1~~TRINITY_DN17796_c0_g1_i1.p1  ORF type:complete len:678 (-),score=112.22 TRINITY_DN17796_c0_g1_i1:89-2122(-)
MKPRFFHGVSALLLFLMSDARMESNQEGFENHVPSCVGDECEEVDAMRVVLLQKRDGKQSMILSNDPSTPTNPVTPVKPEKSGLKGFNWKMIFAGATDAVNGLVNLHKGRGRPCANAGTALQGVGKVCTMVSIGLMTPPLTLAGGCGMALCGALFLGGTGMESACREDPASPEGPTLSDVNAQLQEVAEEISKLREDMGRLEDEVIHGFQEISKILVQGEVQQIMRVVEEVVYHYRSMMSEAARNGMMLPDTFSLDVGPAEFARFQSHLSSSQVDYVVSMMLKVEVPTQTMLQTINDMLSSRVFLFALQMRYRNQHNKSLSFPVDMLASDLPVYDHYLTKRCFYAEEVDSFTTMSPGCFTGLPEHRQMSVSGNLSELPRDLSEVLLPRACWVKGGRLADLPPALRILDLCSFETEVAVEAAGTLLDFPRALTRLQFRSAARLDGDIKDLPRNLIVLQLTSWGGGNISGSFADLPHALTHLDLTFNGQAQLQDLPNNGNLTHVSLSCFSDSCGGGVTGTLKDVGSSLKVLVLKNKLGKSVEGHVRDLPQSLVELDLGDNVKVRGRVSDIPSSVKKFSLWRNCAVYFPRDGEYGELARFETFRVCGCDFRSGKLSYYSEGAQCGQVSPTPEPTPQPTHAPTRRRRRRRSWWWQKSEDATEGGPQPPKASSVEEKPDSTA